MRRLLLALCVPSLALAGTNDLDWSARLLNASGAPLQGDMNVDIVLRNAAGTTLNTWNFPAAPVQDGYLNAVLQDADAAWFRDGATVQVVVDGVAMGSPTELQSTGTSLVATSTWGAFTAGGGAGWTVDPSGTFYARVSDGSGTRDAMQLTTTDTVLTGPVGVDGAFTVDNGDAEIGRFTSGQDNTLSVQADNGHVASIELYANASDQTSSVVYLGQSLAHGAGLLYNGDDTPDMLGEADDFTFFRRSSSVDHPVFGWHHTTSTVQFFDGIQVDNNATISGNTTLTGSATVGGDLVVNDNIITLDALAEGENATLSVLADNNHTATVQALGNGQGTGRIYAGQSGSHGGGFLYNGDDSPAEIGTSDRIIHFRRSNSVDHEVFSYSYNSAQVTFATTPSYTSDGRFKENVQPITGALDTVSQLRGVTYDWMDGRTDHTQYGVIAQEVQSVVPDLVSTNAEGHLAVDYNGLLPLLIESVQELKAENEALRRDLESLRDGVAERD